MTKWEIGDQAEVLEDFSTLYGNFKKGEVHTVNFVDCGGYPTFEGDKSEDGWHGFWFRKVEPNETTQPDPVNHPNHYTNHPSGIECIQITEHMGFCLGNAMKYIWRADLKGNSIEDLRKAAWYIEREIEKREKGNG